jgi:hypothetical protein
VANRVKSSPEWAKDLCVEAFRECGVKLREDDSLILVAAVFRRALDSWFRENEEDLKDHAIAVKAIGADFAGELRSIMSEESERFRDGLRADVKSANYGAEQAVSRALNIGGKDSQWKYRMEGVGIGVALVLIGVLLMVYLKK